MRLRVQLILDILLHVELLVGREIGEGEHQRIAHEEELGSVPLTQLSALAQKIKTVKIWTQKSVRNIKSKREATRKIQ